jgi:hypothetical protein
MSVENENARIYLTDCGCVRIETKHSRTTMTIEKFRDFARNFNKEIDKNETSYEFSKRFSIKNNVRSAEKSGFVNSNGFVKRNKF